MTWRQLAFKNTLHSARRYFGYLSSSALAVAVFFLFSCFTLNKSVQGGYMARDAKYVFSGCEYVVIVFAVFFILFFHAALIRMRSREFGLFRVLGMGPGQTWRMLMTESVLLGLVAMIVGIAVGTLFLKLFLMAMGRILELPNAIPFAVPRGAVVMTVVLFGILFVVEAAIIATRTALRTPKSLMLAERARQKLPQASWIWVLIGVAALVIAYYLAVFRSIDLTRNFFPIVLLTAFGTYLLYSQISVMVLQFIRKRPMQGTTLLIAARFAHRMKDNARVLTVVTLLSTMVLCGMGSVFGLNSIVTQNAAHIDPFPIMLIHSEATALPIKPADVEAKLRAAGTPTSQTLSVPVSVATIVQNEPGVERQYHMTMISASQFERTKKAIWNADPGLRKYLNAPAAPSTGHANLYVPYPLVTGNLFKKPDVHLQGLPNLTLSVNGQYQTRIFNEQTNGVLPDYMLEVSDEDYAKLVATLPASTKYTIHAFSVSQWKQTQSVVDALKQQLPGDMKKCVSDRVTNDIEARQLFSVMLFAGFFVSALFFMAGVSAIYCKLQAQTEGDMRQYFSLRRIGMQRREMGRILNVELLLLFFVPVAVALVHSVVAMADFSHLIMLQGTAWPVFGIVVGIYVLFTAVYFLIARGRYLRQIAGVD